MDLLRKLSRQISWQAVVGKPLHLPQYSLKDVASHCTIDSCWMVVNDKVYDFTDFIEFHPGGLELMLEYAGTDATNAFSEKPHTIEAAEMLKQYLVGELAKEDRMINS